MGSGVVKSVFGEEVIVEDFGGVGSWVMYLEF